MSAKETEQRLNPERSWWMSTALTLTTEGEVDVSVRVWNGDPLFGFRATSMFYLLDANDTMVRLRHIS